jgi:hypothetical protein
VMCNVGLDHLDISGVESVPTYRRKRECDVQRESGPRVFRVYSGWDNSSPARLLKFIYIYIYIYIYICIYWIEESFYVIRN